MSDFDSAFAGAAEALIGAFGRPATFRSHMDAPRDIKVDVDLSDTAAENNGAFLAYALLSDFTTEPEKNDTVAIDGVDYRIADEPNFDRAIGEVSMRIRKIATR